jgi:hypothetical protein
LQAIPFRWRENHLKSDHPDMNEKTIVGILLALNLVVLAGQIWPEGAPAFARAVNIVSLAGSLLFFAHRLRRSRSF